MTTGPVQLLMLGFDEPQFTGEIKAEVARLRDHDVIRLVDAIVLVKDAEGNVSLLEEEDMPQGDQEGIIAVLIGLVEAETEMLAEASGLADELGTWTVDDLLPAGTAAAIALIEHRWAVGLRGAVERANGTVLSDAWVHPEDLELVGLVAAEAMPANEGADDV